MEGLKKAVRSAISSQEQDPKLASISSSSFDKSSFRHGSSALSSQQSQLLLTRPPRQVVSLWTCSKLCAIFFVAGVVVGYTLKRRVRRWASKLLKRLKDD